MHELVTPAKAGVQEFMASQHWIPAFADMTSELYFVVPDQQHGGGVQRLRPSMARRTPIMSSPPWPPARVSLNSR